MVNIIIVLRLISRNLYIIGIALLVCAGVALYFSEEYFPFIYSALITLFFGSILHLFTAKQTYDGTINKKEASLIVALSWFFIGLAGSLPYVFSGAIPQFIDAFFESVSGFTTTGSSILTDIESLPKSILFWRSLTHWIGGIGIIVLVIVIMPSLHIGGYHLFTLESSLQEKIQSKIKSVGIRLLFIYVLLTVTEVILLLLGNMDLYESICHAFGTVATGGFSPKNDSISGYSPYIQYVIMVFMILSGTNFVIHYYLLKRNFNKVRENDELRFYLWAITIIGIIITLSLFIETNRSFETSFRHSFFQVVSIITCTGFATDDYLLWPEYAWIIIFFAMFLGGSTGSTAGGIKMARHLILFKNIKKIFKHLLSPNAVISIVLNKKVLHADTNGSILTFIVLYLVVFGIGSLSLILLGVDEATASSAVATCMAGIGPGIGTVGPASNFAHLPDLVKFILTICMFIGRLEIYTVLILFTKHFWKY